MPSQQELLRLDVPARPAFVGVARSVVTSVATTIDGLDDDRLDDLRLAVSEACTNAVAGEADRVIVTCVRDDGSLEVSIQDPGRRADAPGLDGDGFALQLLTALVDEVHFEEGDGSSTIRLRMAIDPRF
jgi:anti-sigma regulatory factor (Ser/Thr protein kinase)